MTELVAPPGVRFACTQCGDCCRGWNVLLGPGEKERIEALDWRGRVEELAGETTAVALPRAGRKSAQRHRLAHRADGSCLFLGARNQCLIHEHFGGEVKPLLCRLYPFGFYPMGDRVGVDVSFACCSVSEGTGTEVGSRQTEWQLLLDQVGEIKDPRKHQLDAKRRAAGETLWELEHALVSLLGNERLTLIERVRAATMFLDAGTSADPSTPLAGELRKALLETLPRRAGEQPPPVGLERTQRAMLRQLLFLALNPIPTGFDQLSAAERERLRSERLAAGEAFRDKVGQPWIDNEERSVTHERIDRVDASTANAPELAGWIARYLMAKIIGQKFLQIEGGEIDFLQGMRLLLLRAPMALWTAKALAAERGVEAVERIDVQRAIKLLDRSPIAVPPEALNAEQREALRFLLFETQMILSATAELLGLTTDGAA